MTEQTPATTEQKPKKERMIVHNDSSFESLLDTGKFDQLYRVASLFADSTIVPEQFQGNPANCFIGVQMAVRLNTDPLMFLQQCYVVHGKPGIEAKLAIALANRSGVFRGRIRYILTGEGDNRQCEAFGVDASTGDRCSHTVSVRMAKQAGWWQQNKNWQSLTDLMLQYRSAMFLIRTHCPEAIMGMQTREELEDTAEQTRYAANLNEQSVTLSDLAQPQLADSQPPEPKAPPTSVIDVPAEDDPAMEPEPEAPLEAAPTPLPEPDPEAAPENEQEPEPEGEATHPLAVEFRQKIADAKNPGVLLAVKQEIMAKQKQLGEEWTGTLCAECDEALASKRSKKK